MGNRPSKKPAVELKTHEEHPMTNEEAKTIQKLQRLQSRKRTKRKLVNFCDIEATPPQSPRDGQKDDIQKEIQTLVKKKKNEEASNGNFMPLALMKADVTKIDVTKGQSYLKKKNKSEFQIKVPIPPVKRHSKFKSIPFEYEKQLKTYDVARHDWFGETENIFEPQTTRRDFLNSPKAVNFNLKFTKNAKKERVMTEGNEESVPYAPIFKPKRPSKLNLNFEGMHLEVPKPKASENLLPATPMINRGQPGLRSLVKERSLQFIDPMPFASFSGKDSSIRSPPPSALPVLPDTPIGPKNKIIRLRTKIRSNLSKDLANEKLEAPKNLKDQIVWKGQNGYIDRWIINLFLNKNMSLKDFLLISKLGEGAYSVVWKALRICDNEVYALKKVSLGKLKPKEKSNGLNEVRILASINHPNVIAYKEAFFDDDSNSLCIVMEYADDGDLYQRVLEYQKKGTYMAENFIWDVLIQLTKGLKALHKLNIMHRDLKSANVFLCKDGSVKLGDMNVSKVAKQGMMNTQTGTPYYASPEVWKDAPYDIKSDIWSLGCVIYEAITLKPPFQAEDMQGLYKKVIKGDYHPIPRGFSQDLANVISQLIQVDPKLRPSCSQILMMPAVTRRVNLIEEDENIDNYLLGTIKMHKNMPQDKLPRAKYRDDLRQNLSEPPPENDSDIKQLTSKQKTKDSLKMKKNAFSGRVKDYSFDSLGNLEKFGLSSVKRKSIRNKSEMRENYDTLKLPGVSQKTRKYKVFDGIESLKREGYLMKYMPLPQRRRVFQRNPNTNQSYIVHL
ncbi:unnamed protein product [Blepharisma stoltei]|uniref:non-specific serine/threonine protein kinase n=1 Tax=Blepharisma stoltei TaxID=1481888 RepID=A0AAU9KDD1_9CILI|nr:unnamed protein product [Blepharisma stoltei]